MNDVYGLPRRTPSTSGVARIPVMAHPKSIACRVGFNIQRWGAIKTARSMTSHGELADQVRACVSV
eukprot:9498102-Pyramimonas_sp.AAC.1